MRPTAVLRLGSNFGGALPYSVEAGRRQRSIEMV